MRFSAMSFISPAESGQKFCGTVPFGENISSSRCRRAFVGVLARESDGSSETKGSAAAETPRCLMNSRRECMGVMVWILLRYRPTKGQVLYRKPNPHPVYREKETELSPPRPFHGAQPSSQSPRSICEY